VPANAPAPPPRPRPRRPEPVRDLDAEAVRAALELVSGKWVPHVLIALAERPMRSGQLKRVVGQAVNDKVFIQTVRRMEADGLLTREVLNDTPPAVLYLLTAKGQSVLEPLRVLTRWYGSDSPR
jgi:DNA-binding HxlR family transcriptional regulator